jgi:hypothetical protein
LILSYLFLILAGQIAGSRSRLHFDYVHFNELMGRSSAKLAVAVAYQLREAPDQRAFLASSSSTCLNWQHGSNGALWEAIFTDKRHETPQQILASFGKIITTMSSIPYKVANFEKDSAQNCVIAVGLGISRCRAYLATRTGSPNTFKVYTAALRDMDVAIARGIHVGWPKTKKDYDSVMRILRYSATAFYKDAR